MRYLPPRHLAFLVALMLAGLTLAACGGDESDDDFIISAARINAMCPKTGIAQTSLTSDNGYQSASITCKSGKVGVIQAWDHNEAPAEGQQVIAP